MFSAGTASWISAASELKIRISVSGMRMIMLHMTAVLAKTRRLMIRMVFRTRPGLQAP